MLNAACVAIAIAFVSLTTPADYAHVRSDNPRLRRLADRGLEQSETFRQISAALGDSDVIIYFDSGDCECRRARACLSFVATAGGVRYLRASVSLKQIDDELIQQMGHELQHAVEVASEPDITSESSLAAFYSSHAQSCGSVRCYETRAALIVQQAIRRDLKRSRRTNQ